MLIPSETWNTLIPVLNKWILHDRDADEQALQSG